MNEELYVKDDKRVLVVGGGGKQYGKSRAVEMMKMAMIEQGYTQTTYSTEKTRDMFWVDEMSSYYDIKPASTEYPLTHFDTMPRIAPSNLIMKLIERI
jgi:archaellum biogenesis ATPase FlaH